MTTLDEWIEREFTGYGVAVRRERDAPIPGEPLMSMAVAKDLARRAVKEFSSELPAGGQDWEQRANDSIKHHAFVALYKLCRTLGNFKNGVEHNGIDEGEVYASGIFDLVEAALRLPYVLPAHAPHAEVRASVIEECAKIALAIDSSRGNEKEIAKAIHALSPPSERETE